MSGIMWTRTGVVFTTPRHRLMIKVAGTSCVLDNSSGSHLDTFTKPCSIYQYRISIVDISTLLKNIDIDIDIDMVIFENIDIDIDKESLENIDINIDIDKDILENIDIDKEILENIDID